MESELQLWQQKYEKLLGKVKSSSETTADEDEGTKKYTDFYEKVVDSSQALSHQLKTKEEEI